VRPSSFEYHSPDSLEEALELMNDLDDAVVLAGGQTLVPLLNMRLVRPSVVVGLEAVRELSFITGSDDVRIGAMARQHEVMSSPVVRAALPLLAHATRYVGQPQTRSRGTIGGCVAFGSNVAEMSVALLALDASVTLRSARATRTLPLDQFFVDNLVTALAPAELVVELSAPTWPAGAVWGFSELKLRGCDFPIVVCAVALHLGPDGRVEDARVAIGGAGPTPRRLPEIEAALFGRTPTTEDGGSIGRLAQEILQPEDDSHAPADYRRAVAAVHLDRALRVAFASQGRADA
jgi:carbon-monoxide dehydrogenase medium subunit